MKRFFINILVIAVIWLGICHWVYAIRHPEMTDTQRFLHTKDALLFR